MSRPSGVRNYALSSVVALFKVCSDREAGVRAAAELPSPSTGVGTFSGLQTVINGNAEVFHTGRPHNNHGPPVALFNPILGLLAHRLSHVDKDDPAIRPDHHESKWAHEFIHASLECYDSETTRIIAIRRFIESLHPEVHWKEPINKVEPDVLLGALTHFPSGVGEIKNEAGLRGDASMQACLSYAKIVTENRAAVRKGLHIFVFCPDKASVDDEGPEIQQLPSNSLRPHGRRGRDRHHGLH